MVVGPNVPCLPTFKSRLIGWDSVLEALAALCRRVRSEPADCAEGRGAEAKEGVTSDRDHQERCAGAVDVLREIHLSLPLRLLRIPEHC